MASDLNNTMTMEDSYSDVYHIIQEVLFGVICIVGLIGNSLVIYVIARFSKMQTVTNMYIVNLAIADELFLIGIPFLIITMLNKRWIFGEFMCKTYMTITGINQFTSSTFLCIMSADRYVAVCHPISSPRWRTPFISKLVSFLAWLWSIALMVPIIIHAKQVTKEDGNYSCQLFDEAVIANTTDIDPETLATTFTLYNFCLGFAVPLTLILFFYFSVIHKLRTVGPQIKSKERKRSHRKVTKLVLTVVAVYILCWLPYWLSQLPIIYQTNAKVGVILHLIASCLTYSNSAVNPILYAFISENFKKSFLKACKCVGDDMLGGTIVESSVFPLKSKKYSKQYKKRISLAPTADTELDQSPIPVNTKQANVKNGSSNIEETTLIS